MSETADFYSSWLGCASFGAVSKRAIAAPEPIVFQPTDLSNCSVWLDANDGATIIDVSGSLTSWANKGTFGGSANANDGVVLTGTDTINSLNVMKFQAYADLLFNWTQVSNPITCFIVMKPITDLTTAGLPYMNFFDALSTIYNFGTSMYYDSGLMQFGYGCGANNLGVYCLGYNSTNPTNIPV